MDDLLKQFPWLVLVGPVIGAIIHWLKTQKKLRGWQLLIASAAISAVVVSTYGLGNGWTLTDWKQLPFLVFILVSGSSFTGTTLQHVTDEKEFPPGDA